MQSAVAEFRSDPASVVVMAAGVVAKGAGVTAADGAQGRGTHGLAAMPLLVRYSAIASVSAWVRQYLSVVTIFTKTCT